VTLKDKSGADIYITLIFVMNRNNISEAPDFVKMADSLGVNQVRFEYMTIFEPEQVEYSCFFIKELAKEKLMEAKTMPVRDGFAGLPSAFWRDMPQQLIMKFAVSPGILFTLTLTSR